MDDLVKAFCVGTMGIGSENEMGALLGVAKDVSGKLLVDTHAILEKDDGGFGGETWGKISESGEGVVGFCGDEKGVDGGVERHLVAPVSL